MINKFKPENTSDIKFQLLSVASLLSKINDGLSMEEMYEYAERKFDILIGLLSNKYSNDDISISNGYSLNELKKLALTIFQHLISNPESNPFMTICVSELASFDEIKRRRNKLLHVFHPDRNWGEISNGKMTVKINEAFEQIIHNNTSEKINNNSRTTISPSYVKHYSHQKKIFEKKFYLIIVIFVTILAFISLMKLISIF